MAGVIVYLIKMMAAAGCGIGMCLCLCSVECMCVNGNPVDPDDLPFILLIIHVRLQQNNLAIT